MNSYGIVILAAGASTRLGQSKQLLQYKGESLIQRIARISLDVVPSPVVVVLGARAETIRTQIDHFPVRCVYNRDWTTGIASSIKKGLETVLEISPQLNDVLFAVCDQPYISQDLFREMINERRKSNKPIIACTYEDTLGTPVIFSKQFFHELLQLKDLEGAKKIMQHHPHAIQSVAFPLGNVDIDTVQDLAALNV